MKLYLGLAENAAPYQTRIFADIESKLIDLNLAYSACFAQRHGNLAGAYELASFYFPETIAIFLERGDEARKALEEVVFFARQRGVRDLRGPSGEKVVYAPNEVRLLPPLQNPEKSFVIGFSDQARIEAMPKAEIPTGFYKLPQTFVTTGAPMVWPKFSREVDADGCLAIIIGKPGRRIPPERAWDYVAGVTLLIDVTARDINRREGLTTNNLLGKNFPSSTSLGPALWLTSSRKDLEALEVNLSLDGVSKQKFMLPQCVFTLEQVIARWSILGIKPGDFLALGASMALAGDRLQSPVPLTLGSTIRCSSPAIGELTHGVVSPKGLRS
jgi:2-keto-4-pentenoate hydratase/2-oxohepta-3-ene-1,7-dioic acid hydratase in catechol pathway